MRRHHTSAETKINCCRHSNDNICVSLVVLENLLQNYRRGSGSCFTPLSRAKRSSPINREVSQRVFSTGSVPWRLLQTASVDHLCPWVMWPWRRRSLNSHTFFDTFILLLLRLLFFYGFLWQKQTAANVPSWILPSRRNFFSLFTRLKQANCHWSMNTSLE